MKWFYRLKLGAKLMGGFMLVALLAAGIGAVGYRGMGEMSASMQGIAKVRLPGVEALGLLNEAQTAIQRAERTCMLIMKKEEHDHQLKRLADAWEKVDKGWKMYAALPKTGEEEALWRQFVPAWETWKKDHQRVMELIGEGQAAPAQALSVGAARLSYNEAERLLGKMLQLNYQLAEQETVKGTEVSAAAERALIFMVACGFLLAVAIGMFITRGVQGQLGGDPLEVVEITRKVALGDLSMQIDTTGKKGDSLLVAMQKMVETIRDLAADADMLSRAAREGRLAVRADPTRHQGEFRKIVAGVNDTLDAVIGPLNVAADYVDRISKGNLPPPIAANYQGDFNAVKNNLNLLIEATGRIAAAARQVADGNLMVDLRQRSDEDELMHALSAMVAKLVEVVTDVRTAADNVAAGSVELSVSAQSMSQGATEQAAAAEEASASMEQMSSNIRQNADNACQTEKIAVKSADDAREGGGGGGRDRAGHEGDRRQDLRHRGDRPPDQHAGAERGHRGGARRGARQGVRRGGERGEKACRKEPARGGRDLRALHLQRRGGRKGGDHARQHTAGHPENGRPGAGDQRLQQGAGYRRSADQQGDPAVGPGDPAKRLGERTDGRHRRGAFLPIRPAAVGHRFLQGGRGVLRPACRGRRPAGGQGRSESARPVGRGARRQEGDRSGTCDGPILAGGCRLCQILKRIRATRGAARLTTGGFHPSRTGGNTHV